MSSSTRSLERQPPAADRKVALAPLLGVLLAVWFMIAPSFLAYPLGGGGENPSLRDRGVALLLLFVAVAWARAHTHQRRFLIAYAVLSLLLVVEALTVEGGFGGPLGVQPWSELVVGILGLLIAAGGWRASGTNREEQPPAQEEAP